MSESPARSRLPLYLLFALAAVATVLVHVVFVPRHLTSAFLVVLPFLVVGWVAFGLAFYSLGRLFSSPGDMPNMRAADTGSALFLFSIVVSGILDTAGLTVATAPIAHALPALGIYVGLALAGWGFGQRTKVINRIAGGDK